MSTKSKLSTLPSSLPTQKLLTSLDESEGRSQAYNAGIVHLSRKNGSDPVCNHKKAHITYGYEDFGKSTQQKCKRCEAKHAIWTKIKAKNKLQEDAPTCSMGTSSSTSGPIQTFDPILKKKILRRKFSSFKKK